jgi:probable HAF family extracellular repeat protein
MVGIGDLPGGAALSIATSVSTSGNVIVGYSASANGPEEAFRWTHAGGMTGLGDLPGGAFASRATDVSSNGYVVVGYGTPGPDSLMAFRWSGGSMTALGDLPGGLVASRAMSVSGDGVTVTGWGNSGPIGVNEAFLWTQLQGLLGLGFIPGSLNQGTQGVALSFDGRTVAGSGWAGFGVEAFRWRPAFGYQTLGDLPGGGPQPLSAAFAISGDATTIVGMGSTQLGAEAFIWTEAEGMQHLGQKLIALGADLPGWVLKEARGVSVHGKVIVGTGTHNGADEAWLARLEPVCAADLNGDGAVNVTDTLTLLAIPYGLCLNCADCPGDINGDCSVGGASHRDNGATLDGR